MVYGPIAKIIAVAQTREEAINTMERALSEYVVKGIKTTIPFHQQLMRNEEFRKRNFITKFIESFEMKYVILLFRGKSRLFSS